VLNFDTQRITSIASLHQSDQDTNTKTGIYLNSNKKDENS